MKTSFPEKIFSKIMMEMKDIDRLFEAASQKENFQELIKLGYHYIDANKKQKEQPRDRQVLLCIYYLLILTSLLLLLLLVY